jgi:site-specific DNA-methyltransferase (adenine-specific)
MVSKALFSSNKKNWGTPLPFFKRYDDEFHFTLDAAASEENKLCDRFYSESQDSLLQPWTGRVWCNPPYGRDLFRWVDKACKETLYFERCTLSCLLLPARTDTKWFHEIVIPHGEFEFIKGRIKFVGAKHVAPFPSMIVVFQREVTVGRVMDVVPENLHIGARAA